MQVRVKLPISGVPEELSNTLTNNAISLQQLGKRYATSAQVDGGIVRFSKCDRPMVALKFALPFVHSRNFSPANIVQTT